MAPSAPQSTPSPRWGEGCSEGVGPLLDVIDRNPLTRSSPSARIDLSPPRGGGKIPLGPHMRLRCSSRGG